MTDTKPAGATAKEAIGPDEAAFREHLAHARYQSGVDRGRWRLVEIEWPHAIFVVSAAARPESPDEFALRFQLDGYPQRLPTAGAWHLDEGRYLTAAERPKGVRAGQAFRTDWQNGTALYVPCDRLAIEGHGDWATRYPNWIWDPQEGITRYLRLVHEILNDEDYEGV